MRTRHGIACLLFLCASVLLPGPAWPTDDSCGAAPQQLGDWETASPEDVGLDAAVLCKITRELAAQGHTAAPPDRKNVHAALVVRHGKLVFEAYAAGKDENWGEPLASLLMMPPPSTMCGPSRKASFRCCSASHSSENSSLERRFRSCPSFRNTRS